MTVEFVILSLLQKGEKSKEFKARFLDLWILRFLAKAQYDNESEYSVTLSMTTKKSV